MELPVDGPQPSLLALESSNANTPKSYKEECEEKWMSTYQNLVQFNAENGHCSVPRKSKTHKALGEWVHNQRKAYKANRLSQRRADLLEALGFIWRPGTNSWKDTYDKLVEWKAEHGDCNVPSKCPSDLQLAKWVERQRKRYQDQAIPEEQMNLLNDIGFVFEPNSTKWNSSYQKLREYYEQHGNADVPNKYKVDPALGRWCMKQRSDYRDQKLSDERCNLLEEIGFDFRRDSTAGGTKYTPKKTKSVTNEERHIELLNKCKKALAKCEEDKERLKEENKRKAVTIKEQADTIKRLKATIRALASD